MLVLHSLLPKLLGFKALKFDSYIILICKKKNTAVFVAKQLTYNNNFYCNFTG